MTEDIRQHSEIRIVVVDDNRNFQNLMRTILRNLGFRRIEMFGDSDAALGHLTQNFIDFAFVDLAMPHLDGLEWISTVRHLRSVQNQLMPCVLVTGHSSKRTVHSAIKAGADDVLSKPVSPKAIHDHMLRLLESPRSYVHSAGGYFGPDVHDLRSHMSREAPGPRELLAANAQRATRRPHGPTGPVPGLNVPVRPVPSDTTFLD